MMNRKESICIVMPLSDDVVLRLMPIIKYLNRNYSKIVILFFDLYKGAFNYRHIIQEFQTANLEVFGFDSFLEGKDLINKFRSYDFLFLIKYPQINYKFFILFLLFLITKSKSKRLIWSNVILIRRSYSNLIRRYGELMVLFFAVLKSVLLHFFFYIECFLAYYFFLVLYKTLWQRKVLKDKSYLDPKKILFIRMDHLGDIICSLPSLSALRKKFPNSAITFLGAPWSCQPLKANQHLYDKLIIWDAPWHNKSNKYKMGLKELVKFLRFVPKLRSENFDLIIQPRGEGINVVLSLLAGGKFVVSGVDMRRPLARMMANYIDLPIFLNPYITYHIAEWPKLCLEKIGVTIQEEDIRCYRIGTFEEFECVIGNYQEEGFRLCAVIIGAGSRVRRWSPIKFAALINQLHKRRIYTILVGAKEESDVRDDILKYVEVDVIDLVGKTDFLNLPSVLSSADFVISLDTSVMHLASLIGKKIIALFGAGNLNLAKPIFSEGFVLKKELGCSGCGDICIFRKKKRYPCMEMILVDNIVNAVVNYVLAI